MGVAASGILKIAGASAFAFFNYRTTLCSLPNSQLANHKTRNKRIGARQERPTDTHKEARHSAGLQCINWDYAAALSSRGTLLRARMVSKSSRTRISPFR